jgi:hypothetical protein
MDQRREGENPLGAFSFLDWEHTAHANPNLPVSIPSVQPAISRSSIDWMSSHIHSPLKLFTLIHAVPWVFLAQKSGVFPDGQDDRCEVREKSRLLSM